MVLMEIKITITAPDTMSEAEMDELVNGDLYDVAEEISDAAKDQIKELHVPGLTIEVDY